MVQHVQHVGVHYSIYSLYPPSTSSRALSLSLPIPVDFVHCMVQGIFHPSISFTSLGQEDKIAATCPKSIAAMAKDALNPVDGDGHVPQGLPGKQ